jgi:hypothetical protein
MSGNIDNQKETGPVELFDGHAPQPVPKYLLPNKTTRRRVNKDTTPQEMEAVQKCVLALRPLRIEQRRRVLQAIYVLLDIQPSG